MTLKSLSGLCLTKLQDLSPDLLMPDQYGEVRKAIRSLAMYFNGISRSTTITLVASVREYGTANDSAKQGVTVLGAGFPEDFYSSDHVIDWSTNYLSLITKGQRLESSTGVPTAFYIDNARMGFDRIPGTSENGKIITFLYHGTGADVTLGADVVLPEFGIQDNDPFWDAICEYYMIEYWRRRLEKERQKGVGFEPGILICRQAIADHQKILSDLLVKVSRRFDSKYGTAAMVVSLPEYFEQSDNNVYVDHGRIIRRNQ